MARGWIKLYRRITDNDMWFSERFTKAQAWIDLLLLAAHKPKSATLRGVGVRLEPGQLAYSVVSLAKRWQWNERTVSNFLKSLNRRQMILSKTSNVTTVITVINYSRYQNTTEQTTEQTTERLQSKLQTIKNDKNEKNIKPPIVPRMGQELIDLFNRLYGKSYTLTLGREKKYHLRRKNFDDSTLQLALKNMHSVPFYRGENDRAWTPDPDYFLRSDEQIDKFLNIKKKENLIIL